MTVLHATIFDSTGGDNMRNTFTSSVLATLLTITAAVIVDVAWSADSDPLVVESDFTGITRVIFVGATLGEDWDGFPSVLAADYTATGSLDQLNVTLPLYVSWISDSDVDMDAHAVDPPEAITEYAWFDHEKFILGGIEGPALDGLYTACAEGDYLEAPAGAHPYFPLTSQGELHVQDIHGGIGQKTAIYLLGMDDLEEPTTLILVVVGWAEPDSRFDDNLQTTVHLAPGGIWTRRVEWYENFETFVDVRTVEWVSTDVGFASRRAVDAADFSAFAECYGNNPPTPVRWGWSQGESPTSSPNFKCNFAPFGGSANYLDSADIGAWSGDTGKSCGLSKASPEEDPARILAWFGFAPTGGTVVYGPNGETAPEYELVDAEQRDHAIANPYGYRHQPATGAMTVIPWGQVKGLYR